MQEYTSIDWKDNQSKTIDLLRFPLAIFVLYIHRVPTTENAFSADFAFLSWHGIYNFLGLFISQGIAVIAVPTFFLISGYLFFVNFKEWSWDGYKKKIKSRTKTLIIPYILWNVLSFLFIIAKGVGDIFTKGSSWSDVIEIINDNGLHFLWDCNKWAETQYSWLPWTTYLTGPIDLPLWFLRDLIVVTLLSPVIYWVVKNTKIWGIIALLFAYILYFWGNWPGFTITSFFYFGLGAYFALNNHNVVVFARKYKFLFVVLSLVAYVFYFYYHQVDNDIVGISRNVFTASTFFCAFVVASLFVEKKNMMPNKLLVSSCFFIYAEHKCAPIGALGWVNYIMSRLIPGQTYIEETICLIINPIITAFLLVGVYLLMKRFTPKIAGLLSGNR